MSELAFNLSGEPFEIPSAAVGWRVRRLKPKKGAPEVVYGRDGTPLTLPVDADMEDLRREARIEGRYRLDPIDDHNRTIVNAPAGYVCLHAIERDPEPVPPPSPAPQGYDHVVIEAMRMNSEAMRMNTELARTIVDRFPAMMDSAAGLLRAADGAGLPAREPRALPEPPEEEEEEGDDEPEIEEPEQVAAKPSGWAGLLETLIPLVAPAIPAIIGAITSGKVQLPGSVAALFGGRPTSPKASAASAAGVRTASTPGATPAPSGPAVARPTSSPVRASSPRDTAQASAQATSSVRASGPRDTAPAVPQATSSVRASGPRDTAPAAKVAPSSVSSPRDATGPRDAAGLRDATGPRDAAGTRDAAGPSAVVRASTLHDPPGLAPPTHGLGGMRDAAGPHDAMDPHDAAHVASKAPDVEHASASERANTPGSATEITAELPELDLADLTHFAAIQGALTFRESMLARELAAELSPAELRTWLTELQTLSVPEAVAKIRGILGTDGSNNTSGGAS